MPGDPRQSEQLTGLLADAGRTGFRGRTPAVKKGETYQDRGKEMVENHLIPIVIQFMFARMRS